MISTVLSLAPRDQVLGNLELVLVKKPNVGPVSKCDKSDLILVHNFIVNSVPALVVDEVEGALHRFDLGHEPAVLWGLAVDLH